MTPTQQHELDYTDQEYIYLAALKYLDRTVGTDVMLYTSDLEVSPL